MASWGTNFLLLQKHESEKDLKSQQWGTNYILLYAYAYDYPPGLTSFTFH